MYVLVGGCVCNVRGKDRGGVAGIQRVPRTSSDCGLGYVYMKARRCWSPHHLSREIYCSESEPTTVVSTHARPRTHVWNFGFCFQSAATHCKSYCCTDPQPGQAKARGCRRQGVQEEASQTQTIRQGGVRVRERGRRGASEGARDGVSSCTHGVYRRICAGVHSLAYVNLCDNLSVAKTCIIS